MILVDTNLLLRAVISSDPQHALAVTAVKSVRQLGYVIYVVPQVLYEFWVVVTRPESDNGIGWSCDRARTEVGGIVTHFPLLSDRPTLYDAWLDLVTSPQVHGKTAHDARLVAAMVIHNLTHLLTFNTQDFQRFTEITVVDRVEVDQLKPLT